MTNKYYEKQLPEGYTEAKIIDAKKGLTAILLTVGSLVLTLLSGYVLLMLVKPAFVIDLDNIEGLFVRYVVFIILMFAYIVLHEIVHGVIYKLLTGEKLKFGITLTAAYCGVPGIYPYRKTALMSLFGPFVVFNIVFTVGLLVSRDPINRLILIVLFAIHIGGCIGDLYDICLLLFQYRRADTIVFDDGPKQIIYVRNED